MEVLDLGDFSQYTNGSSQTRHLSNGNGTKRQKVNDDFKPGNITKVTIKNFTTYSYAEFILSPTLNMIIGPNGTGKSTLVAAICLGLGGKLDLIKRKLMKSMIKSGQETGEITIELRDKSNSPLTIHREFTEKTTLWKLNHSKALEKQVVTQVQLLNIQLDNLCHFLPQERVAEFAGLSPEKLLLETQRTLNSGNLYIMHEDLIKLDNERDAAIEALKTLSDDLNFLESEQQKLAEEVKKLQLYNDKVQEYENHKLLLPYAIREEEKALKAQLKQNLQDAKRRLNEFDDHHKPLSDELKLTEATLSDNDKRIKSQLKTVEKAVSKHKDSKEAAETIRKEIQVFLGQLKTRKLSRENVAEGIERLKVEVSDLNGRLTRLDEEHQVSPNRQKELRKERSGIMEELDRISYEAENATDDLATKRRRAERLQWSIKQESSKLNTNDKLNMLAPGHFANQNNSSSRLVNSTFQLHRALRQKPDLKPFYFEAPVVTCEVTEKSIAGLVERIITVNSLLAITCTSNENYNKIPHQLLKQFNAPSRISQHTAPASPARSSLEQYGFEGFLSDYVKGPKQVLNMLNLNAKLQQIPVVFKPLSDDQIQRLVTPGPDGRVPFMRFVAGQQLFSLSRSKYGSRQVVYTTETITNSKFFGVQDGLSAQARSDIEKKIQNLKQDEEMITSEIKEHEETRASLKLTIDGLKSEIRELELEIKKISSVEHNRTKLTTAITSRKEKIERLKKEYNEDRSEQIKAIKAKIIERNESLAEAHDSSAKAASVLAQETLNLNELKYLRVDLLNKTESIGILLNELGQYKESLISVHDAAKSEYDNMKQSDASKQIRQQRESYTEEQESQIADLAKAYIDDKVLNEKYIREKINLLQDEMNIMSTADNNSIHRLQEVEDKIQEHRVRLPKAEQVKAGVDDRMAAIEAVWEPELRELVNKISISFQKRFISVASDGQVQLTKGNKYKDWRLEIMVKFRNESDLKVLDRQSQSGGERAVSTIFFVMALQGLTQAPLRIVDEINQGMDPKNEKMAHKYFVHTACQSSSSQYFLVTPKLLTGLYYHPKMKIHCIYTGPLIDSAKKSSTAGDFMDFTNLY